MADDMERRRFLFRAFGGFMGVALGGMWAEAGELPGAMPGPHFRPRARSVIFLFMCGGVSHLDTFDPKGNAHAGRLIDAVGFGDNQARMQRPVIPCHRTFARRGASGIPVSDWFPHVGGVIDEIAVVRSMWCHEVNHFPAVIETCTGHRGRQFDHPSFGAWISHALGSANRNLPTFVNLGRPSSPVQLTGGYLGAGVSATPFQAGAEPVANLRPPGGMSGAARERWMERLEGMNAEFRTRHGLEADIRARARAYELAGRMQAAAPEAVDFPSEPAHVRALYGLDQPHTEAFGKQLLLARRLAERGVRFIQVCHAGGGNGGWDSHGDMKTHEPLCRATDQPIAGLIRDLRQRGMLDDTLVVWTSEFGRTPWSQNTTGRDHNPRGYTSWLAGGGVRGGIVHGATDEFGYRAVESPHYYSDLNATILHLMGLDPSRMEHPALGPVSRLVERGGPIHEILA